MWDEKIFCTTYLFYSLVVMFTQSEVDKELSQIKTHIGFVSSVNVSKQTREHKAGVQFGGKITAHNA